jgi:hypothetical protein
MLAEENRMGWFGRGARWDVDLYVEVSPHAFIFRSKSETFARPAEVGPGTGTGIRLLGARTYTPPASTLPLFPAGLEAAPVPPRYDHLRAFLNDAFSHSVDNRRIKLKPRVVLHGAASLDPVLHGYQYELLRRAVLEAGARVVRFTEKAPLAPPEGYELPVTLPELRMQGYYHRQGRIPRFRRLRKARNDD